MEDQKEKLGKRFRNQSWTKPDQISNTQRAGTPEGTDGCFGLERGNRFVRRFKLYFRNGNVISIPYAFLPVFLFSPDKDLKIRTGEMEVTVKGRGMGKLSDHLNEEKVIWIKESASGVDTGDSEVFVESIAIDGDLLT